MRAPRRLIWPPDLLEDFLAGQRPAPSTTPSDNSSIAGTKQRRPAMSAATGPGASPLAGGNVVDFDRLRNERRT
jgi:hypothetical protein